MGKIVCVCVCVLYRERKCVRVCNWEIEVKLLLHLYWNVYVHMLLCWNLYWCEQQLIEFGHSVPIFTLRRMSFYKIFKNVKSWLSYNVLFCCLAIGVIVLSKRRYGRSIWVRDQGWINLNELDNPGNYRLPLYPHPSQNCKCGGLKNHI